MRSKNGWLSFPDSCHHFDVDLFLELLLLLIDTFFVIEHLKKNLIKMIADCFFFPLPWSHSVVCTLCITREVLKWFLIFSKVCSDFREIFLELSICWGRFVSCFIANTLSPAFSIGKQQKNHGTAPGIKNKLFCCTGDKPKQVLHKLPKKATR